MRTISSGVKTEISMEGLEVHAGVGARLDGMKDGILIVGVGLGGRL